jgi:hypothetical protein
MSHGWNTEQLGNIDAPTLRAMSDITGAADQSLKTMVTGVAVIFVDWHGGRKLLGFVICFLRILEGPPRLVNAGLTGLTRFGQDVLSVRSGGHVDELPDSSAVVSGSSRA